MIITATIGDLTTNTTSSNIPLTGIPGLEMPPIRLASYNLAGQHFGRHVSAYYGKRRFSLMGWVIGSTIADFITKRDSLQTALSVMEGPIPITFTLAGGRQLRITAVPVSFECPPQPGIPSAAEFHAEFEAAFPFLLSTTDQVSVLTLATGGGGTVPPPTMPMALSASSGGSVYLINSGTAPTFPIARITGPVTNPAIRNFGSDQELRFDLTLLAGEYIDIDFVSHTVMDNTGRSRYDAKVGDWWSLMPGSTDIRFVADSSDPTASAVITHQDAYLGL